MDGLLALLDLLRDILTYPLIFTFSVIAYLIITEDLDYCVTSEDEQEFNNGKVFIGTGLDE